MKYIVTYDTATREISVLTEEAGHQTSIEGVTSVNFSQSGFSIWRHDRLAASEKGVFTSEGKRALEKPAITTLKNQPEPIATIKLAADPKKTRRDIQRYFAILEDGDD